jgi:uncharacterized protein (TIGR00369 family)
MDDAQLLALFKGMPTPPSAAHLGAQFLEIDVKAGRVVIEFEARPEFVNPAGVVQGGFLAAMLDDTMGPAGAIASRGEFFTSTIDMNVSFLAPARVGKLIGRGKVVQMGNTIAFLQATLEDPDGRIVARATSSARLTRGVFKKTAKRAAGAEESVDR